jgi:hypothetical protein
MVTITLPNDLHARVTHDAAEVGKHIVCEKPLCLTLEEAEQSGYIIASYNQSVDLLAANVQGFRASATGYGLASSGYEKASLA